MGLCVDEGALTSATAIWFPYRDAPYRREWERHNGPQCSDFTPIFIGMHRNTPLSPMKRVPGYTIPMVPMHLPPMAPMNLVEQIRALRLPVRPAPAHCVITPGETDDDIFGTTTQPPYTQPTKDGPAAAHCVITLLTRCVVLAIKR